MSDSTQQAIQLTDSDLGKSGKEKMENIICCQCMFDFILRLAVCNVQIKVKSIDCLDPQIPVIAIQHSFFLGPG